MEFDIVWETEDGEFPIESTQELEEAIKQLENRDDCSSILIEVEPAYNNIIVLELDYVKITKGGLFKKTEVVDTHYRLHAVVDVSEEEDFINYFYKTTSYEEVKNIMLDFIEQKKTPTVSNWSMDNKNY